MSEPPSSDMPDFDNMSPEELQAQWTALESERESLLAERDIFEAQRKEMGSEVRLYVGNLSQSTNEALLKEYFQGFGEIKSVHILRDQEGNHKCSGFVTFYYTPDAERAKEEMNDVFKDQGHTANMVVSFARQKQRPSEGATPTAPIAPSQAQRGVYHPQNQFPYPPQSQQQHMQAVPMPFVPHHMGMTPHSVPSHGQASTASNTVLYVNRLAPNVTEDMLRELFGVFGTITQAKVMANNGYAFVHYSDPAAARMAIAQMNGTDKLSTDTLEVSLKTPSRKQQHASTGGAGSGSGLGSGPRTGAMRRERPDSAGMGSGASASMGMPMSMPMAMPMGGMGGMGGMGMPPMPGMHYSNMPMYFDPSYAQVAAMGNPAMVSHMGMPMGMPMGGAADVGGVGSHDGRGARDTRTGAHGGLDTRGGRSGPSAHGTGQRYTPY